MTECLWALGSDSTGAVSWWAWRDPVTILTLPPTSSESTEKPTEDRADREAKMSCLTALACTEQHEEVVMWKAGKPTI